MHLLIIYIVIIIVHLLILFVVFADPPMPSGGQPKSLPVLEQSAEEVLKHTTLFRGVADYRRLEKVVSNGKHVTIIGGGFLGSELACAIGHKGGFDAIIVGLVAAWERW